MKQVLPLKLDYIYIGDVLEKLKLIPDKCVRCIVTSPPYYGLRDYSTATWIGGDLNCDHKKATRDTINTSLAKSTLKCVIESQRTGYEQKLTNKSVCNRCGAIRVDQQIGLEKTPELYIEKLVAVFRECRRVLTDDGTLWLNIGDSYWGGKGQSGDARPDIQKERLQNGESISKVAQNIGEKGQLSPLQGKHSIIKPKDLIGIPWMLAFALRADGWYLRQDICWFKKNCMPECLDPETNVFIKKNGWVSKITLRKLSQMSEFPEILSPNGWVKINNIWKTKKAAIKLEAGKVEYVICSPNHRFPISSDRRRVKSRLELAKNIRHEGYADYFLYCPINKFLVPSITTWMGQLLDYELGYLLGAYLAEGGHDGLRGFRIKITIHINETSFQEKIQQICEKLQIVVRRSENKEHNYQCLFLTEEWFSKTVDAFISGTVKTKALNIEMILNTPFDFRQGILDGYVMGDGSDRKGGGWIITSASRRLRDDVATLSSSLGIITSKGAGTKYLDKRTGKEYSQHSLWTPYMTKRKIKSGSVGVFQVPPRRRKMLKGKREMIDIEVDGGLFLIGEGLITHNSVLDRCTKAHEYIFLFSKQPKYFYDSVAIREPLKVNSVLRYNQNVENQQGTIRANGTSRTDRPFKAVRKSGNLQRKYGDSVGAPDGTDKHQGRSVPWEGDTANKKSVWEMTPAQFSEAHFATFPAELPATIIKAGTSAYGQCSLCGSAWVRITEKELRATNKVSYGTKPDDRDDKADANDQGSNRVKDGHVPGLAASYTTKGWRPTCECSGKLIKHAHKDEEGKKKTVIEYVPDIPIEDHPVRPDVVLDPFMGAGTTALVAKRLQRNFIGIELNKKYVKEISIPRLIREFGHMFYQPQTEFE